MKKKNNVCILLHSEDMDPKKKIQEKEKTESKSLL